MGCYGGGERKTYTVEWRILGALAVLNDGSEGRQEEAEEKKAAKNE